MILSVVLALFPATAWTAQKAGARQPSAYATPLQVYVVDGQLDPQKVRHIFPGADVYDPTERESALRRVVLPLARQAHFFKQSGLTAVTRNLSHFDRDMLVRRLRYSDAKAVHDHFKGISIADARRAQAIVRRLR